MIQKVYVGVILLVSIIAATRGQGSTPNTKIFQPPGSSTIGQIAGTSTPWVLPEFVTIINEFKDNVFEDLQASTVVKKIWNLETESSKSREIIFNLVNKFLDDLNHPAPAALANILSKSASRFEPLPIQIIFEGHAIHLAEFFLIKNIKIERETATRYANAISQGLASADVNKTESVFNGILTGYGNFIVSYGFNIGDIVDEVLELLTSVFVILLEK